ncbi:chorismate synthase [Pyrodictium delaneyi]|uniref:Chorismate synthase n=1 Tax=Pyrodictium delaneyi TaxID=1273541 RepID=A0A211YS53_9CREN|nr:chorismate synthase [Pyrodictium delaneyi]
MGSALRLSIFGESHGCCIGAVLEGVPPGIPLSPEEINRELELRRPGRRLTTPRREEDRVEILSGVYMGYTTGAPLAMLIRNRDVDSSFYEQVVRHRPRPGHADLTARLRSMGFNDYRGGGPFSGRLTAAIVAAGTVAKKIAGLHGVRFYAYLRALGPAECPPPNGSAEDWIQQLQQLREERNKSTVFCHDAEASKEMEQALIEAMKNGDSLGGLVELWILGVPPGLGEPPFDTLDGDLAKAFFAIPGVKAIEFGTGMAIARMRGSEATDNLVLSPEGAPIPTPGHSGGILGGLSTGGPIVARIAFKPTSTIRLPQRTIDWRGLEETEMTGGGRHDPAIAVRAVPVVEAMAALVVADHLLRWLSWRLEHYHRLERGLEAEKENWF